MSARRFPLLLPTRISLALAFVLAAMWYAGASQGNAANYLLLFTTLSVVLVSIPQTALNLNGLKVKVESIKPAFAGQEIAVPIEIVNQSRKTRRSCKVELPEKNGAPEMVDEIASGSGARVTLRFPALRRGKYEISDLRLTSTYPLGFLQARRHAAASQPYFIYPKPVGDSRLPLHRPSAAPTGREAFLGEGDDFAGVRAYVPGESQRHIDWRAVARGQPRMTKQFTVEADDLLRFDFAQVVLPETEDRLSQLTLWIVEAERARRRYGLRLPGLEIAPSSGEPHYHRCLQALALFQ